MPGCMDVLVDEYAAAQGAGDYHEMARIKQEMYDYAGRPWSTREAPSGLVAKGAMQRG